MRGILSYVDQEPRISLRDFCYTHNAPVPRGPPPWTGEVDGVVMAGAYDPRIVAWVQSAGVPTVNAGGDLMSTPIVCVSSDPQSLARTAIDHLYGVGYRSFLYVGVAKTGGSLRHRDAIAAELQRRGCTLHAVDAVLDRTGHIKIGPHVARRITRLKKPLAILALNDVFAVPMVPLVRRMGFGIPEEVGILGMGDTALARISSPPISTIRTAVESVGCEAVRLVHRMIDGRKIAGKHFQVQGEQLIVPRFDGSQTPLGRRRHRAGARTDPPESLRGD